VVNELEIETDEEEKRKEGRVGKKKKGIIWEPHINKDESRNGWKKNERFGKKPIDDRKNEKKRQKGVYRQKETKGVT